MDIEEYKRATVNIKTILNSLGLKMPLSYNGANIMDAKPLETNVMGIIPILLENDIEYINVEINDIKTW